MDIGGSSRREEAGQFIIWHHPSVQRGSRNTTPTMQRCRCSEAQLCMLIDIMIYASSVVCRKASVVGTACGRMPRQGNYTKLHVPHHEWCETPHPGLKNTPRNNDARFLSTPSQTGIHHPDRRRCEGTPSAVLRCAPHCTSPLRDAAGLST